MQQISLKPLFHRNYQQIGIYFNKDIEIINSLKKIPNTKWSQTNKCWYIPLSKQNYQTLTHNLQQQATFNVVELKIFLQNRNEVNQTHIAIEQPNLLLLKSSAPTVNTNTSHSNVTQTNSTSTNTISLATSKYYLTRISPQNQQALQQLKDQLILKAYSPSTIKTYTNEFAAMLQLLKNVPASTLSILQVKRYIKYCINTLQLSENTIHSRLNALKFYYEQVLQQARFFVELPRPKKQIQLPNILGERDLERLFNGISNLKHKAILFTAYSAGLRVSEAVALELKHIDSDRMQIIIKNAKGKKDRVVGLSPVLLDVLRQYIKQLPTKPRLYLFEGQYQGEPYNTRSAQRVFQLAKNGANIKKEVSFHSLRHSFATHLLEKGVDIKYIKDLLGHFNIRTTERYLHVSKTKLINIVSPLDDLWEKGKIKL